MAQYNEGALQHSPEELEFFAEDEEVTIVPHFTLSTHQSKLRCVEGEYGPFKANFPVKAPLWLAIYLHHRKQCRIQPPDWLKVDYLQDVFEAERRTSSAFQEMPWHYLEVSHLLLTHARECFGPKEHMEVRDLVDQIRRVRANKINAGLELITGPLTAKLNNVACMEINTLRPFFLGSLDRFYRMSKMTDPLGDASGGGDGGGGDDDGAGAGNGGDRQTPQPRRQLRPG